MTKNPFVNALCAAGYIIAIVLFLTYGTQMASDKEDTLIIPMAMLSLFVLSAAVMGTIFFLTPIQMYLDGQKNEAITLFLKTLGTFAVLTAVFMFTALMVG